MATTWNAVTTNNNTEYQVPSTQSSFLMVNDGQQTSQRGSRRPRFFRSKTRWAYSTLQDSFP